MVKEVSNTGKLTAIGEKIEKLSIAIGSLAKDGHNDFSNYDFISSEQMITALRGSCLEYGLSIIPSVVDYEERDSVNDKGKAVVRSIVRMNFRIIDLDTGYEIMESFVGAENDTGGKSMQQAITQCTKYFYFKLFKVTSKDEIDSDRVTNEVTKPKAQDKAWLNKGTEAFSKAVVAVATEGITISQIEKKYRLSKEVKELLTNEIKGN